MPKKREIPLPASSVDTLKKILKAYYYCREKPTDNSQIASRAGISKQDVSRNNGFLSYLGILSVGARKQLTEDGRKLALAMVNDQSEEEGVLWLEALSRGEVTQKAIHAIQVQGSIQKKDIANKLAHSLGVILDGYVTTGVHTLLDILLKAGVIQEGDEDYSYREPTPGNPPSQVPAGLPNAHAGESSEQRPVGTPTAATEPKKSLAYPDRVPPTVHIDIQVHISSEATPEQIDQVFASMAKHLYGKD
jgi:hypothetical protein